MVLVSVTVIGVQSDAGRASHMMVLVPGGKGT
jgi:hypothetical protein